MTRWEPWLGFAVLAWAGAAHGGAYMRSEGELLNDWRVEYSRSDREWDASGDARGTPCAQQHTSLMTSLDYGFSYYLTGFTKLGIASSQCEEAAAGPAAESTRETGPSDFTAGLRGRLNPFANNRSWEVEGYVPSRALGGRSQLGCDAYGGAVRLSARDEIVPGGFIGYGAGYRHWAEPLAPQALATLEYSAPMNRLAKDPRWDWGASLAGTWTLQEGETVQQDPATTLDCGSRARIVRAALDVRYRVGLHSRAGCGISSPVWGRDTRVTYGLSCAYSVLWE
jgi:hypothetical protein